MNSEQQYIELFQQYKDAICVPCPEVMNRPREEAFKSFCASGFPTLKTERYKYTDVQKAFAPNYGLNLNRIEIKAQTQDIFKCDVPNLSTLLYFVVNDSFNKFEIPSYELPKGVTICSLSDAARQYPEIVKKHYARIASGFPTIRQTTDNAAAPGEHDAITDLNTMFAQDGLFVHISKNTKLDKTLQVINLLHAKVDMMINRRVLIVLEESAEAKILFCDHTMDNQNFLTTQVTEVFAGENSSLELYELEETHAKNLRFSNLYIDQEAYSRVSVNSLTLQGGTTRNTTYVTLKGHDAEINLYGGVIADKKQHVDNHTLIDHQAPNCQSNELYKYVLDDEAVGAFAGRILVRKDAQKTQSQETNANLCSTPTARMYTQPMLEIYADDVKCNHGATVGQLNEQAIFYMRQRGIPLEEARMLLKFAFIGDVLDKIALEPLRDRLHYLTEKRIRGEFNQCTGCRLCQ